MKAEGQVHHRFHGNYSAVVALVFASAEDAQIGLSFLLGFQVAEKLNVIWRLVHGRKNGESVDTRTELDEVKELLERFRVYEKNDHRGPIDGTPFSIDYGPRFHLDFTQAIADREVAARQLQLF